MRLFGIESCAAGSPAGIVGPRHAHDRNIAYVATGTCSSDSNFIERCVAQGPGRGRLSVSLGTYLFVNGLTGKPYTGALPPPMDF